MPRHSVQQYRGVALEERGVQEEPPLVAEREAEELVREDGVEHAPATSTRAGRGAPPPVAAAALRVAARGEGREGRATALREEVDRGVVEEEPVHL